MVNRLLYLENAIKLHEQVDKIGTLLSETEWAIVRLIKPALEPFMTVRKILEGEKYVTISLFVLYISDF